MYQMAATQLELTRKRRDKNQPIMHKHKVKEGDLVLIHDHVAKSFAPKYKENFRIVKFLGKNQLQVKETMTGKLQYVHITDVKKASMIDRVADQLPDYSSFGRAAKLQLNPANILSLVWKLPVDVNALTFQANKQVRNHITASNFQLLQAFSILTEYYYSSYILNLLTNFEISVQVQCVEVTIVNIQCIHSILQHIDQRKN